MNKDCGGRESGSDAGSINVDPHKHVLKPLYISFMGNVAAQHYFLSYSRIDKEVALKLAQDLKAAHVNIWIDQLDIEPGSIWDEAIETALQNCKGMLFVASHASVSSDNALNEVHYALRENKSIIPIKIDDCKIPLLIIRHNYIDLSVDYNRKFSELLNRVRHDDGQQPVSETAASSINESHFKNQPSENGPSKSLRKKGKAPIGRLAAIGVVLVVVAIALFIWLGDSDDDVSQNQGSLPVESIKDAATDKPSGTADSLYEAGMELYDQKDYSAALNHFQEAANDGSIAAMVKLGEMYSKGEGIERDDQTAIEWYTKAARQGDVVAMYSLADLYENGLGVKHDYQKAMQWYTAAADGGYKYAFANIGDLYYEGKGVGVNYKKAVEWYEKAAAAGEANGTHSLGFMYENGYGVAADQTKANDLYKKAKDLGYVEEE